MNKLILVCAALLVVAGLAVPAAQAQSCYKFIAFCDGIQIDKINTGGWIQAQWYRWDCTNNTPIIGAAVDILNPCGDTVAARYSFLCLSELGCLSDYLEGDWVFAFVPRRDGRGYDIDLIQGTPWGPASCDIDNIAYTRYLGPCTGDAPEQGDALTSSIE